jgi:hypothetical protein
VELWYYSASSGSFSALETQRAIVYGVLQDRGAGGKRLMRRERHTMERDRTLSNAAVLYDVWDAYGTVTS